MTDPDTPPPAATDADQLPRHTTPTWEVEMLISGAAVFAMLQFPGWLSTHMLPLMPRFTSDISSALVVLYTYLISTAIVLAITFMLHLVLRAHWIALVGMHSVFPDGVRWDKMRIGPVEREVSQQRDRGAAASIDRADNRATMVFAFGTMLATTLLVLSIAALVALAIAVFVNMVSGHQIDTVYVLLALVFLIILPLFAAMLLDRRWASRTRPNSIVRRLLGTLLKGYARMGFVQGFTTSRLLESHLGSRRFQYLLITALMPVILGVGMTLATWKAPFRFGSYSLFPAFAEQPLRAVASTHYDDQRNPLRDPAVAYIQSEVVTGSYLKLIVPYLPARDDAILRHHCPAALAAHSDTARAGARLDCLAALHPVSLDGKSLSPHYDLASDPRTDRPALQAMIDIRALPPGQHELRVARTLAPAGSHHHHESKTWTIVFWR